MNQGGKRATSDASMKLIAFSCAVIVTLVLIGCSDKTITFRGTVVTYKHVKLDSIRLTYFVTDRNFSENLRRGTATVDSDGIFTIRIWHPEHVPYWLVIDGVEGISEVSIINNAYEVTEKREAERNIGELYVYDYIRILEDYPSPIVIRDLRVHWQSNIQDVDFYKVELVGAISISGIKGNSFSFESIGSLIEKQGRNKVGEIEITNRRERIEGAFFLDVKAQRIIRGKPVSVGGAEQKLVKIVQE